MSRLLMGTLSHMAAPGLRHSGINTSQMSCRDQMELLPSVDLLTKVTFPHINSSSLPITDCLTRNSRGKSQTSSDRWESTGPKRNYQPCLRNLILHNPPLLHEISLTEFYSRYPQTAAWNQHHLKQSSHLIVKLMSTYFTGMWECTVLCSCPVWRATNALSKAPDNRMRFHKMPPRHKPPRPVALCFSDCQSRCDVTDHWRAGVTPLDLLLH